MIQEPAFRDPILPVNIWMTLPSHLISPNPHFIICTRVRHSLRFSFAQNPMTALRFPLCRMFVVLYGHQLSEAK